MYHRSRRPVRCGIGATTRMRRHIHHRWPGRLGYWSAMTANPSAAALTATIDLDALAHNIGVLRETSGTG